MSDEHIAYIYLYIRLRCLANFHCVDARILVGGPKIEIHSSSRPFARKHYACTTHTHTHTHITQTKRFNQLLGACEWRYIYSICMRLKRMANVRQPLCARSVYQRFIYFSHNPIFAEILGRGGQG